jgi:hypothetical protein
MALAKSSMAVLIVHHPAIIMIHLPDCPDIGLIPDIGLHRDDDTSYG